MADLKVVPLRLERELFMALATYALEHNMSRTAVCRDAIAAKLAIKLPSTAASKEVISNGESEKPARKRKGK